MEKIEQRYFFALWPDKQTQQYYAKFAHQYLNDCEGKFVSTQNLHITLSFLGALNNKQLKTVKHIAETIKSDSFTLALDRLGYWKEPQVIWIAPSKVPSSLIEIDAALQLKFRENEINSDQRSYKPHMTLMRKALSTPINIQPKPVEWRVKHCVLVRSTLDLKGAIYDVIEEWPLK